MRFALHLKEDPARWHIDPTGVWREANFYGADSGRMPCGAKGSYGGRLDPNQVPTWFITHPEDSWCIDCLEMAVTETWPPDPEWRIAT